MVTKVCITCGEEKGENQFYHNGKGRGGRSGRCIVCTKKIITKYNTERRSALRGLHTCSKCGHEKAAGSFYLGKTGKPSKVCKLCDVKSFPVVLPSEKKKLALREKFRLAGQGFGPDGKKLQEIT